MLANLHDVSEAGTPLTTSECIVRDDVEHARLAQALRNHSEVWRRDPVSHWTANTVL